MNKTAITVLLLFCAAGADAVLLIAECLDDISLKRLHDEAVSLGMTPLVELYEAGNVSRVLDVGARLIGVNNRNLKSFEVDLEHTVGFSVRLAGIDNGPVLAKPGKGLVEGQIDDVGIAAPEVGGHGDGLAIPADDGDLAAGVEIELESPTGADLELAFDGFSCGEGAGEQDDEKGDRQILAHDETPWLVVHRFSVWSIASESAGPNGRSSTFISSRVSRLQASC